MNRASLILGLGLLGYVGCASFESSFCDYGFCTGTTTDAGSDATTPQDASTDAGRDADPLPEGCTTPNEPVKNPEKCLVDSFGAFVSPTGDDGNAGTKAKPFKTIGKALTAGRDRVVVCEGTYAGSLTIGRKVEIYGGVDCEFKGPGAKAKIEASAPGFAVKVSQASDTLLSDLSLLGQNGAQPGESSIGLFVSESTNVKLVRLTIEAGEGAAAAPMKNGSFVYPGASMLKGENADDNATPGTPGDDKGGPGGKTGTCPGGGTSSGGKGGDASLQGADGLPMPPGGARGAIAGCGAGGTGLDGLVGKIGGDSAGASVVGKVSSAGFVGSSGEDGKSGFPGGGGGGGYGTGGAGGGGGAGGCGGQGGFGGTSGGSSIAVVSFQSSVTVQASELNAKNGKPGGIGGSGQLGQDGGIRGAGSGSACNGGSGNKGGDGGAGGGGAGGVSVGIVWSGGTAPTKDGLTKVTRASGSPAEGGANGAGGGKGAPGVNEDIFELK
jgi:hypothetical protein